MAQSVDPTTAAAMPAREQKSVSDDVRGTYSCEPAYKP